MEVSGLPVLVNINRCEGKRRAGLEVLDAAEEVYETMTCGYPSREHFDLDVIGAAINRLKKALAVKKNPSAVQKANWFIDFMNACRLYGAMLDELDGINIDADVGATKRELGRKLVTYRHPPHTKKIERDKQLVALFKKQKQSHSNLSLTDLYKLVADDWNREQTKGKNKLQILAARERQQMLPEVTPTIVRNAVLTAQKASKI